MLQKPVPGAGAACGFGHHQIIHMQVGATGEGVHWPHAHDAEQITARECADQYITVPPRLDIQRFPESLQRQVGAQFLQDAPRGFVFVLVDRADL